DDNLREKLLNINLLIANIESLKDNPTPSSNVITKSSSTFLNLFLEETNTFDNSSPESGTFCFDLEENSCGSTTTRSDYSLLDYEAFYSNDDHIKEKSSGSTTTHADFSQYDSFIFDLSINPFPPADRSDFYHEEFADELAHIISPSEYDHFCFKIEPELGNLTMDVVKTGLFEAIDSFIPLNEHLATFQGGVENKSSVGSKLIASGEECLDGWVEAGGGEVTGGGVVFGVSRIEFGMILEYNIGESGGEALRLDGGADS
ncbi:hypothetical protein Tco_0692040, partial [Tanacetum coccineum]